VSDGLLVLERELERELRAGQPFSFLSVPLQN